MQSTKPLLIVSTPMSLTADVRERIMSHLEGLGERIGYEVAVFDGGFKAEVDSSQAVLEQLTIIANGQAQANQLLAALVDALAEEPGDPDQEPRTYLNGQPVN